MQTARAGGPRAQGVYLAGAPPALRVLVAHAMSVRVCRGPPRHRGPPRRRALPRHRPPPRRRALPRHRGLPRRRLPRPRGGAERQSSLSRQERTCPRQPCGTSVPARRRRSQFSSVFPHPPPPCGALLGPAGGRPVLFYMCDCGRVRGGPAWGDQAVWVVF